ncbi:hypothetical protein MRB53_004973 [Persea americana]|uniref:Uncharacterized protein n=1 Tax=Persea americana TaxID=3435 RepID=A0ACC2MC17_PERAE|nr:hypothetical protein MRB53_004973 [Persea americana]
MGLACHIAKIHREASVERNAWELKQYIEELYWGSGKRVLLLRHSKGGVDAAAALAIYSSALKDKVAGLALVQSPYGGTPIASDILQASVAPGVLSTIYHVAHVELPWLPLPCFSNDELDSGQVGRKVPVVIPMAAAMAICALHLRFRYGEKSDGLVTCRDAEVRGSVVVQPDQKLDHAWISSGKKDTDDPDAFEMCEALFTLLVEIGNAKQERVEG